MLSVLDIVFEKNDGFNFVILDEGGDVFVCCSVVEVDSEKLLIC